MSSTDIALRCVGLRKAFGRTRVLEGVDLEVATGSILAVLGPSGGGKTTLLRLIAGFERADAGEIQLRGTTVAGHGSFTAPERRGVGIVPQEGALFPHLSVADNVGYGLRRSRERPARVGECLELVGLVGYERARPHELSGGQQQRVALARALAPRPSVVLLDEPFASLDAALRVHVRAEVCGVLRDAGATAVLVTHDQHEALSVADRVAVLLHGSVLQSSDPVTLYRAPNSLEVATFVGEGAVIPGRRVGGGVECALGLLPVACAQGDLATGDGVSADVVVVVRPEQVIFGDSEPGAAGHPTDAAVAGVVSGSAFFGDTTVVKLDVPGLDAPITARLQASSLPAVGERVRIRIRGPVLAYPVPADSDSDS
ncbi:MAG: ABC transporter ATP-binding protein [Acidimicrobiia bacterium]